MCNIHPVRMINAPCTKGKYRVVYSSSTSISTSISNTSSTHISMEYYCSNLITTQISPLQFFHGPTKRTHGIPH